MPRLPGLVGHWTFRSEYLLWSASTYLPGVAATVAGAAAARLLDARRRGWSRGRTASTGGWATVAGCLAAVFLPFALVDWWRHIYFVLPALFLLFVIIPAVALVNAGLAALAYRDLHWLQSRRSRDTGASVEREVATAAVEQADDAGGVTGLAVERSWTRTVLGLLGSAGGLAWLALAAPTLVPAVLGWPVEPRDPVFALLFFWFPGLALAAVGTLLWGAGRWSVRLRLWFGALVAMRVLGGVLWASSGDSNLQIGFTQLLPVRLQVPLLERLLTSPWYDTRSAAASTLGRIGPTARRAVPALEALVERTPPSTWDWAALAIAQIDPAHAARHPNPRVSSGARSRRRAVASSGMLFGQEVGSGAPPQLGAEVIRPSLLSVSSH